MENRLPFYGPFTPEDIKQIDHTGRRILECIGIRIHCQDSLNMLNKAGAQIDYDAQIVRFEMTY